MTTRNHSGSRTHLGGVAPLAPVRSQGRARNRFPAWLKKTIPTVGKKADVEALLSGHRLHTVCREARCPNLAECFCRGTATLLIMGDRCTRDCSFCSVTHATPMPLDPDEPRRICETVKKLGLSYVVITSVTRDDLPDGGAGHFAATVEALKSSMEAVRVEVLVPDFRGNQGALKTVLDSGPDVLNHNVETVPRLYCQIRPQADYRTSLRLLEQAAAHGKGLVTKSGFMVGLGERDDEVASVLRDLRASRCSIVTIGQYLQPSSQQFPVQRFVPPERFEYYEQIGRQMGLAHVCAGPFVRSSYRASEVFRRIVDE